MAQVSTQSKTIDTPYSSSSKTDVRVSNPSVYYSAQPALAGQIYAAGGAPIYENHHAKLAYAAVPQATVNYAAAAPAYSYAAAAPVAHTQAYFPQQQYATYSAPAAYPTAQQVLAAPSAGYIAKTTYAAAPATYQVAQHAPVAYAAPAAYAHPAPAAHAPLIAYSPANQVAHFAYSNANDHINYAW